MDLPGREKSIKKKNFLKNAHIFCNNIYLNSKTVMLQIFHLQFRISCDNLGNIEAQIFR